MPPTKSASPGGAHAYTQRALRVRPHSAARHLVAAGCLIGALASASLAYATPAPRLRGLLKTARLVVSGTVTSVTPYDDDRVAVVTLAIDQILKGSLPGAPPAQVAWVELHEGPIRPGLTVGTRGIAFLRPVARLSYLATVLPPGTYFEVLPDYGAFVSASSKTELDQQAAVVSRLVAAASGRGLDASAERALTFALLASSSPLLVEDAGAGVIDLGKQRKLSAEELAILATALRRDDLPDRVRIALVAAVAKAGVTEAIPALQGIESPPAVAEAAWQALDQLGVPPPREGVEARLANPDPSIRAAAVRELLRRDGTGAISQVAPVAIQDPDPATRKAAVEALGTLARPEVLPPLERVFADSPLELQQAAGRAILAVGGQPAIDAFGRLAFTGPIQSQRYAVILLMTLNDPHKDETLKRIRDTHSDEQIRELVANGFPIHEN